MRILHYNLGLPPQRSGGLTKYSLDLMLEQSKQHEVSLLYPCGWRPFSRSIRWAEGDCFRGIRTLRLLNAFPIPLLFDLASPKDFYQGRVMGRDEMEALYDCLRPDVFHVHTLMGLPKELLLFFKVKGVRLVYTTHDYFGLGTNANFFDEKSALYPVPKRSTLYLRLRSCRLLLKLKNNVLLRRILKK